MTFILFVSCASLTDRQSLFGNEEAEKKPDTVPRAQYEQLLKKYDALMREKKVAKQEAPSEQLVDDVVNRISQANQQKDRLSGTVDLMAGSAMNAPKGVDKRVMPIVEASDYDPEMVENHILKIRKADNLQRQNKFDASLAIIKELDKSPVRQVQVRAKYLLAEILFKQGEYDLAMQIYEEVLNKYAFSGLVVKSLGRLIVCSDKLKQVKKQEKYYSILHDFFEEGA